MTDPAQTIDALVSRLDLKPIGDGHTAIGAIGQTPVTLTVLSVEPLSLLFALNVNCESYDGDFREIIGADLSPQQCQATVETGRGWLSLYEVTQRTDAEIAELVTRFHDSLANLGLAVAEGCLRCGALENAHVMHLDGRTTRICQACLDQAVAEKLEREAELNKVNLSALVGLPAAVLVCAGCWALFWFSMDLALDRLRIEIIEINQLTSALMMAIVIAVGLAIGRPLGTVLRRSGLVRPAPLPITVAIVAGSLVLGEIGYVAISIYRMFGIVDLSAAARLLWQAVTNYTGFWIACKIMCAAAIGGFCLAAVSEQKSERLNV